MGSTLKKYIKAKQKEKKKSKTETKSAPVKFAEKTKGILYLILATSLTIAIIYSNKNLIIKQESIISILFNSLTGKIVLLIMAIAFFIYGLKNLHAIK